MLKEINKIDIAKSTIIHKSNFGKYEYLILPFALAFNPKFIWLFPIITYLLSAEEIIDFSNDTNVKTALAIAFFNAAYYGILMCILLSLTTFLKRYFKRLRPILREDVKRIWNLRGKELNFAMPSGDTSQASLWAFYMYLNLGNPFFLLGIPFVALGRIYYMCHWIGDTMAGTLVGLIIAIFSVSFRKFAYLICDNLYLIIGEFIIPK